jgi:hypothetical protein
MLKDLIKMAGKLDSMGLKRESDIVDALIQKVAAGDSDVIIFLREQIPSLQDEKLKALEELVEDFLYSYGKSKESGNKDHEWHAIDADNAAGEIYGFVKDNGTEIGDTFFDDLKQEFVEDY